jgi:hypothetical protein
LSDFKDIHRSEPPQREQPISSSTIVDDVSSRISKIMNGFPTTPARESAIRQESPIRQELPVRKQNVKKGVISKSREEFERELEEYLDSDCGEKKNTVSNSLNVAQKKMRKISRSPSLLAPSPHRSNSISSAGFSSHTGSEYSVRRRPRRFSNEFEKDEMPRAASKEIRGRRMSTSGHSEPTSSRDVSKESRSRRMSTSTAGWRKISQRKFSGKPRDARRNFGILRPVFVEILGQNGVEMQGKWWQNLDFRV